MKNVNWMYHRKGCTTCGRSDDFFKKHKVKVETIVDAKSGYQLAEALELLKDTEQLFVTKGTKVIHLNLKTEKPTEAELEALIIGPTGKLRAPTIKVGRTLVVGYSETMYKQALG